MLRGMELKEGQVWEYTGDGEGKGLHKILMVDKEESEVVTLHEQATFSGLWPFPDFFKNFKFKSNQ